MSNKKKLLLISPKSAFFFKNEEKNRQLKSLPGFDVHERYWSGIGPALPIIAALTPGHYDVEIVDENIEEIQFQKHYDLVAISTMTNQAIRAYQIAGEFRKKKITTLLGGIHPSMEPEEASRYCDTIVTGEVENLWTDVISDFDNGKLKKRYNADDYPAVDLKNIPVPRYDLLKDKNYKILWLNTTRGCPYDCEFCTATRFFGANQRQKDVDQICGEIQFIKKHFQRILLGFGDNNLFYNKKHSRLMLEKFIDLNINWIAQTDITLGNDESFLKLLFRAGCKSVFIGFESLDEINLDNIYDTKNKLKRNYLNKYEEMVNKIQSNGIGIWGSFIIGLDNDTVASFDKIIEFINRTHMLGAQLTILTPLPGTRLRTRLINENRVLPTSWDNYTFSELNYIPKNLTFQELEEHYFESYTQIFSNENRTAKTRYFMEIMKNLTDH